MTPTLTPTEIATRHHARAVRFFWGFLIGATMVSLIGNIVHAIWHLIPFVVIQIGTAAVPPLFLLAVVDGIALSVRAGASGTVYRWAVTATAVIGVGAFVMSFRALRDLVVHTGVPPVWAWLFPAVIDTAIGVSTLMLVALGDKPARRAPRAGTQTAPVQRTVQTPVQSAKPKVTRPAPANAVAQMVQAKRGTNLCIGTTRPGADGAGLSTNGGTGRCIPCVGADCIRCHYTARRDSDRCPRGNP